MIRHLYLLSKSKRILFLQQLYNPFSTNKIVYKPMMPFAEKYNAIYINQQYSKGIIQSPRSILIYWLPAAGIFINNYLTQWTLTNSVGFAALLFGGSFLRFAYRQFLDNKIQCIQVDSQLKWIYLTSKNVQILPITSTKYFLPTKQQQLLINNYHPMNEKNKPINIEQAHENPQKNQKNENIQKIKKFEEKTNRCRIPIELVQFQMVIPQKQMPEFSRDKQRLSPKQMFKKYENYQILLKHTLKKEGKELPLVFQIDTQQNIQKKHHDYLLALALGYQIDTTGAPKFPDDPLEQQIQKQLKQNKQPTQSQQFDRFMKILKQDNQSKDKNKQKDNQSQKIAQKVAQILKQNQKK